MAEQGLELHWQQIGHLSAVIARAHGSKRAKPSDFNPLAKAKRRKKKQEFAKVREEADLPDNLSEDEIRRRFEEWQESAQ